MASGEPREEVRVGTGSGAVSERISRHILTTPPSAELTPDPLDSDDLPPTTAPRASVASWVRRGSANVSTGEGGATPLPEGTVTVLFTDLVGSTDLNQRLGDEAANAIEREVERLALEQVEKHRGVLVKDTGDGLMAAFQSARRAVACAREIQRGMARRKRDEPSVDVRMRIGLHTGEVIEDDGNLHGETVIVAKRVESAAPAGGIFASETVYGVLGTAREELEDRGQFELKGLASAWRLYEIPSAEEGSGVLPDQDRTPYVGRAAERERCQALAERAQGGRGGLVLISGEAGVGKTRLGQEVAEVAERRGMVVLFGHCIDMEAPPPYQPLVEQLEQAARALTPEALREILGENAPELAKLMPELRQRYGDIPEPPALPPEQERRYLLHGVAEFLERAARTQPLVLVYEDLHWADESTLLLLRDLAPRLAKVPVLAIGSYRHTELSPERPFAASLEALLRARHAEEVVLTTFGEQDVAAMLRGRAGQPPPPELVSLVYSETEGNPFFVEEVFRHLKEVDKLFDAEGRWRSGIQIADTEVPRGVRLVLGRRLERVSEECRQALTVAAVIGRVVPFELLLRSSGLDEDALLDALDESETAHLVEDESRGREARHAFVHEQIRQTLLSALSLPRRQRLHLRVADALEALHGGESEAHAADLAHHLYGAGAAAPADRTLAALHRAGERALASLAFEDVLRHVEWGQEVADEDDVAARAQLAALRARALRGLGRVEDALAALGDALERAPEGPARDAIVQQRARLLLDLFRGGDAREDLTPLLESARERGERERELEILLDLGRAHYILSLDAPGHAGDSRDAYAEAYALAKELGDRAAMARALIPTAWFIDYWADYHDTARANTEEAAGLAEELGDEDLKSEAALSRLRLLSPGESIEEAERLRDHFETRRDPVRLKEHLFWLMWQYWARGDFERSVEACDRGIELAEQLGSAPVQYGSIKAIALVDLGRFDEVGAALAQEVADEAHPFGQAMQQLARSVYLDRLDAWDAAAATARDALGRAGALSRTWMQNWLVGILASLSARMGERGAALREDLERVMAQGFAPSTMARAQQAIADGEPESAVEPLETARMGLLATGMRRHWIDAGETHAEVLLACGRAEEAAAIAAEALAAAEQADGEAMAWRIQARLAQAQGQIGATGKAEASRAAARARHAKLAERIADAELRRAFESQPLARTLTEGASS
jgi:class 3 adenylate cyclase/tetratricopeptide (TPR) repeat protein